MFVNRGLRLQVLIFLCLLGFGVATALQAQNRIIGRVQPNLGRVNSSAEIYDPSDGTFIPSGNLVTPRNGAAATRLPNGKVLITGGYNDVDYLNSAEIYDPATKTSSLTTTVDETTKQIVESDLFTQRAGHTATLLNDGMVLIAGGFNGRYVNTAELYNPTTGVFTQIANSLTTPRAYHTATLQPDGQVLVAGGYNGSYLNSMDLYNPRLLTFTQISSTIGGVRAHHTATLMSNLQILITGGYDGTNYLNTAIVYNPADLSVKNVGPMTATRSEHTACSLPDGRVLIAGGKNGSTLASAETFDPSTNAFTATAGPMAVARDGATSTLLPTGQVLIAGGSDTNPLASAELYDPPSGKFIPSATSMTTARQGHIAAILGDGRVLLVGGLNTRMMVFDINSDTTDNLPPNIVISKDSTKGFVSYTGSGAVLAFSPKTGAVLQTIQTGGNPFHITPLTDNQTLAVVSALDNRIFLIDIGSMKVTSTLTFTNAQFGFGSFVTVSNSGTYGLVSSTGTGEVVKFSLPDGRELSRLGGLQAPAQITLTPDDSTMLVVDVNAVQVVLADPSTMKQKTTLDIRNNWDAFAAFTLSNAVVLSKDGKTAIIASSGLNAESAYSVLVFNASDGSLAALERMANKPYYTTLTPDGQNWVILGADSLLVVPTTDPDGRLELSSKGEPLETSNLIISPDSRYAYYASATFDVFLKQDLSSVAVIGQLNVGDNPNVREDQSSTVAVTPDYTTFLALNFETNNIALIGNETVLDSARFISGHNQFTSLSLINLSGNRANLTITAMHDFGTAVAGNNADGTAYVNPAQITLAPNAQLSTTVDQLFNYDGLTDQSGWMVVESDQPGLVGYVSWGTVKGTFLGSVIDQADGVPLFNVSPANETLLDWIIPEVSRATGTTTELDFLNRNYSQASYDLSRVTSDGSLIVKSTSNSLTTNQRLAQTFMDTYKPPKQGQVLIAGGQQTPTITLNSAESYDPTGGALSPTSGALASAVQSPMAAALSSSRVLIGGGKDGGGNIVNQTELYDPNADTFTPTTGAMNTGRFRGTMTLLGNGKVLIVGGQTSNTTTNTAELYDPIADTFTFTTGTMISARNSHSATLLPNGKVLLAGGSNGNQVVNTAELYDPATGVFSSTGSMAAPRAFHTATLLMNGKVLITGGYNGSYLSSAEIYDPAAGSFSPAINGMSSARSEHTATRLNDGRVLIAGGTDGSAPLDSADLYYPDANVFLTSSTHMNTARSDHGAALLSTGKVTDKVLLVGGTDGTNILDTIDLYDPALDTFTTPSNRLTTPRTNFTATFLAGGTEGYLRGQTTNGVIFTEIYNNSKEISAINGINVDSFKGVYVLYFPQFATLSGFTTTLNVVNASPYTTQLKVILHSANGPVIGKPAVVVLGSGQQLKNDLVSIFGNDPAVKNATGWIEIDTTIDKVVGTVTFSDANGDFLATYQLQGTPSSDFIFPLVTQTDTYMSAMSLLNNSGQTASVGIELWGPSGAMMRSATVTLTSGSRTTFYVNQLFPGLGSVMAGNLRIHSSTPIFGISLLHDSGLSFLCAVPAIEFPSNK